jgi:hypothetical protein
VAIRDRTELQTDRRGTLPGDVRRILGLAASMRVRAIGSALLCQRRPKRPQ